MTKASIPGLITRMAIPTIISMLVTAVYNLADTFFVSQINTQSTAAVGISFSVMAILQSLGFFLDTAQETISPGNWAHKNARKRSRWPLPDSTTHSSWAASLRC